MEKVVPVVTPELSEDINIDEPAVRVDVFENKAEIAQAVQDAKEEIKISLPQFLSRFNLTRAQIYYYQGNFKSDELLIQREWEIITGL